MRVVVTGLLAAFALTACPPNPLYCQPGTVSCGQGCVDPQADKRNCGGCGLACGTNQECNAGTCECQPGTTSCDGQCVVTDYDTHHCGGCGQVCELGVCELGGCREACTAGVSTRCGTACVDPTSDVRHCGGCEQPCAQGQSCHAGACTFDVLAACYGSGQVVGFNADTLTRGSLTPVGSAPGALAVSAGVVLVADDTDQRLYQLAVTRGGLEPVRLANRIGAVPNQVLVDGQVTYVVNAGTATLQVLQAVTEGGDALELDAGLAGTLRLSTVTELPFGANTYPEGAAKLDGALWVPLWGGRGAEAQAGQAVVRVSVANPLAPVEVTRVSLASLDLHTFDGGTAAPRPFAVTAFGGALYAVLNNLDADYQPAGPGLLARIEPATNAVSAVNLGESCLNPVWAAPVGELLAVSCGGRLSPPLYDTVSNAGMVLVDASGAVTARWSSECAGLPDGGACLAMMPGRFAVRGDRVFLGDRNQGRVVVLQVSAAGFTEVRGVAQAPATCPTVPFGLVSDVVAVP